MIAAQLRQVLLAEGSEKAAIENQNDILFFFETFKADFLSFEIRQYEVWGWSVQLDLIDHD